MLPEFRQKLFESRRAYRLKNADAIKAKKKADYNLPSSKAFRHSVEFKARTAASRKRCAKQRAEYQRKYLSIPENKHRKREWMKNRGKNLTKGCCEHIGRNLRRRIREVILETKSGGLNCLCGCTIDELKIHIQKQFKNGMAWNNYGKWHIDHKRPCASFDLTDAEQQKQCFHFTNLQPLWALENLSKSDKTAGQLK